LIQIYEAKEKLKKTKIEVPYIIKVQIMIQIT